MPYMQVSAFFMFSVCSEESFPFLISWEVQPSCLFDFFLLQNDIIILTLSACPVSVIQEQVELFAHG